MAAVLTQDAVLHFIQSGGGSVKNSDLLQHFRNFIRDHADRDRNRELFKKFVNSVATVRQEGGVSHVVLRKQYRGNEGSSKPPQGPESPQRTSLIPAASADKSRPKPQAREADTPAPAGGPASKTILPAAGIMTNNNNNNVGTNITVRQPNSTARPPGRSTAAQSSGPNADETQLKTPSVSKSPVQEQQKTGGQARVGFGPLPGSTPVAPAVPHHGQISQLIPDPVVPEPVVPVPQNLKAREVRLQSEGGLRQEPVPNHVSEVTPRRARYRPSYKSAMSCDEEEEEEEEQLPVRRSLGGAEWPVSGPLRDTARIMSTSSPCIIDNPAPPPSFPPSDRQAPKIFIQDVELESLVSERPVSLSGGPAPAGHSASVEAERSMPPPDPRALGYVQNNPQYSQPAGVQGPVQGQHRHQMVQLSSGPRIIFPQARETGFSSPQKPRGSGWNGGNEDAQPQTAESGQALQIEDLLQQAQSTPLESVTHAAESKTSASPCHQSTGSLHGNQEAKTSGLHFSSGNLIDDYDESSDGSTCTPRLTRRLSREVRSRLSRSLGNDLDQIVKAKLGGGGSEAARLNRLHLISSSLSLRANLSSSSLSSCSTPPRCQSLVELDEGVEHKERRRSPPATTSSSTARQDGHAGQVRQHQPLVPLEPKEHAWYVKAAAGAWPEIYSLFREEPSLLDKQDFISGFSVLHWIAKHGDHRVLNTLWYGMQKQGLTFSVNARSLAGQTPLHIAAIHGRKNIMRLLVKNFSADVKLRDIAGKRPWQYLSSAMTPDIFQLLGAPARAAFGAALSLEQLQQQQLQQQQQQQQQQRRRRHHLSSASSGERPSITPGMPKVKRSTSLAAFLKHKSLLPFNGQQSGTAI